MDTDNDMGIDWGRGEDGVGGGGKRGKTHITQEKYI